MRLSPAICAVPALSASVLLASGLPAGADGLTPGQWQVLSTSEIDGVTGPQSQSIRCLTPEDVGDLDKTFSPVSRTTNSVCESAGHESTPQRLKWHLRCTTGQLDMDVAGEFVFETAEHYTAVITARSSMLGRHLQDSRTTIEGRRLGDCQ